MISPKLLRKRDWIVAAGASLMAWLLAWAAFRFTTPALKALPLAPIAGTSALVLIAVFRKLQRDNLSHYRQIEALLSLRDVLRDSLPLPAMREWAISPDFGLLLASVVRDRCPQVVVEVGSGVSTLVIADLLKQAGKGKLISIEHDARYASRCKATLDVRGLGGVAQIVRAPLVSVAVGSERWRWYDPSTLAEIANVDLLIVDGPPAIQEPLARFPVLPLLMARLREDAVIVLDDADRAGERVAVQRWQSLYDGLDIEYVPTEKGSFVIRRMVSK